MAILVDELREYPDVTLPFTRWCHLATDGSFAELHAFAARLGLRRAWFQGDHYDLPPHGRARAVALGAEEVATGELLERMTGPRGDRARRRGRSPRGLAWLRGDEAPRVLRYPRGDLVIVGGPSGSAFAGRAVDRGRVPVLDAAAALRAALAAGSGAVAVTSALDLDALAAIAAGAGRGAHLLLPDGRDAGPPVQTREAWAALRRALGAAGDPATVVERFASVTVLDREAAQRVERIAL